MTKNLVKEPSSPEQMKMTSNNSLNDSFVQNTDLGLNLGDLHSSKDYYISSEEDYEWETEEDDLISSNKENDLTSTNNNAVDYNEKKTTLITQNIGALVPFDNNDNIDDDDDVEIASDEERVLLKDIKDEIEQKVREEMKSELEMYKVKMKAIENGQLDDDKKTDGDDNMEDIDPIIKEGLLKIKKLDRILNKKVKREKEVKRERLLFERKMKEEIEELKNGRQEHKEVKNNTDKYMALALPPSHNEGIILDEPDVTPVFQTQLDDLDVNKRNNNKKDAKEQKKTNNDLNDSIMEEGDGGKKKRKKKKDFIKRNKELAGHAEDMIAMTEDEKKRVADLLCDLDTLPEQVDDSTPFNEEENPFQISLKPGEGYVPDVTEYRSLTAIDEKLKTILPSDQYHSIITPTIQTPQHKLFTRVDVKSSILDFEKYGEKALIETKEEREMKEKLKHIEEELALFNNPNELKMETSSLTGDKLNELLDECARSMSRTSYISDVESLADPADTTPRSVQSVQSSARSSIYDNPPVLPHDVLQKLLAEAYCPISTKLTSVTEEDEEKSESDDVVEPISAETWKLVAEQPIDEEVAKSFETNRSNDFQDIKSSVEFSENIYTEISDEYKPQYKDKQPFLPEINKSPFLVTQGLNNEQRKLKDERKSSHSDQNSIEIIRNSLKESSLVIESFSECGSEIGDVTPTPRPPTSDKRPLSSQSTRSNRTMTPTAKQF